MRKITFLTLFIFSFISISFADTGTYKILDYRVRLTPYSDGKVEIEYYQKWNVTGGHIPWITVGVPNDNFEIKEYGYTVKKIAPAGESGWSGVRIDLDRDYKPNQTFEISFTIIQNKLFYADEENYNLEFTPGWYDRAFTDYLEVKVRFFTNLKTIKADPKPSSVSGEEMTWTKNKLGKGGKLSISISFPKKLFPKEIREDNLKSGTSTFVIILIIILVVGVLGLLVAAAALLDDDDGYSGGSIFYGGSRGSGRGLSSGGGGGFGGRASSCACACVSCACACACAGGGGAGCNRKDKHSCPVCNQKGERRQ